MGTASVLEGQPVCLGGRRREGWGSSSRHLLHSSQALTRLWAFYSASHPLP